MEAKMAMKRDLKETPEKGVMGEKSALKGLGFCGRREGIGAYAVVCLVRREK